MVSTIQIDRLRARARAAFLGLAVGDALGATVEFMTPQEIRAQHGVLDEIVGGGWLRLRRGAVTDDTEMSLAIARTVVAERGFALRPVAESLVAWLKGNPADVGNTCRRGLRRYMLEGTLEARFAPGDAGNGAAMRMVPIALATLGDPSLLDAHAIAQGHLTHNHPLSDEGCQLVGRLVQRGIATNSVSDLRRIADDTVERFPPFRFDPYRGLATGYVVDTLQTVLHHFFGTSSFEACLVATINQGGDADTTGAIAGAIAGAFYGLDAIPRRWTRRLAPALGEELQELADALVALSPAVQRGATGWP